MSDKVRKVFFVEIHYTQGSWEYVEKFVREFDIDPNSKNVFLSLAEELGYEASWYDEEDEGWHEDDRFVSISYRDLLKLEHEEILRRYL